MSTGAPHSLHVFVRYLRRPFDREKGAIIAAYVAPLPKTRVICVNEFGPLSAKTYSGEEWTPAPPAIFELRLQATRYRLDPWRL